MTRPRSLVHVRLLRSLLAVLLTCQSFQALRAQGPPAAAAEEIEAALRQTGSLSAEGQPLNEVAQQLSQQWGIPISIDERALAEAGMAATSPVSISLENLPRRAVLYHLLRPLDLTYTIAHRRLELTTPEAVELQELIRIYSIGHLITSGEDGKLPALSVDDLHELLGSQIEPDSWDAVGGPATIESFGPSLVIKQTLVAHEDIAQYLEMLGHLREQYQRDAGKVSNMALWMPLQAAVQEALEQPVAIEGQGLTLAAVVAQLNEQLAIPVLIDEPGLGDVGLDASVPVQFTGTELPLQTVLGRLLTPLDLTWSSERGVLLITTPEEAERELELRIYPVYDLVRSGDSGPLQHLAGVVQTSVAPDSWDAVGGPGSLEPIRPVPALSVAQTAEVHAQIEQLLSELRKVLPQGYEPPAVLPSVRIYHLPPEVPSDQMMMALRIFVAPDSWSGKEVQLLPLPGMLIVRQSPEVHQQIRLFLMQLADQGGNGGLAGQGGGLGGQGGGFFNTK